MWKATRDLSIDICYYQGNVIIGTSIFIVINEVW